MYVGIVFRGGRYLKTVRISPAYGKEVAQKKFQAYIENQNKEGGYAPFSGEENVYTGEFLDTDEMPYI